VVVGQAKAAIVALGGVDGVLCFCLVDGPGGANVFTAAAFYTIFHYLVGHKYYLRCHYTIKPSAEKNVTVMKIDIEVNDG
jgi:hypothetical protein